jgi:hypothetical protein
VAREPPVRDDAVVTWGRIGALLVALAAAALLVAGGRAPAASRASGSCALPGGTAALAAAAMRALRAKRDVWGEALLRSRQGPSFAAAQRRLQPVLLARAPRKRPLTESGVHYVPFAQPDGPQGAGAVALHVADGGQIVYDRVGGGSLNVFVGRAGRERYGSCLRRLSIGLAEGYLPVLQTRYVDAAGVRYEQESFAGRLGGSGALASFVRIHAAASAARAAGRIRLATRGSSRSSAVPRGAARDLYVTWIGRSGSLRALEPEAYDAARETVVAYWKRRLAAGAQLEVPEPVVANAARALLVQNLTLAWRYSIGNQYEEFSFPESVDVAQVDAEYGFGDVARSILRVSLTRKPEPYANWKRGEKLLGWATYYRLTRDRAGLRQATPVLRRYVDLLASQLAANGLLRAERYSSDIPDQVRGLHGQAVVWQGLREIAAAWAETGQTALARRSRGVAARLERGLRRAVARSQRRLGDGSLFVPVRLDGERPYGSVTESRAGSYWNLVMPYALASGLFAPGGVQARGIQRYLELHGGRLLGVVRAGAYALYRDPVFPTSGTDHVYNINNARFLADNGRAEDMALGLYGALAVAMAPGTFVSGEAASIAPLVRPDVRSMYLPPNSASNAAFLVTLRLLLLHETRDRAGLPRGLELAAATPRDWLRPGKRIAVRNVPTSFGPLSYEIDTARGTIHAAVDVPSRTRPRSLTLHLRLPKGSRIGVVRVEGQTYDRVNRGSGKIDLSGRSGHVEIDVAYAPSR